MSDNISKYAIIARHARIMTDECGGYFTDNYNRMCKVVADVLAQQQANGTKYNYCMYCEKELKEGEAIVLCKDCTL